MFGRQAWDLFLSYEAQQRRFRGELLGFAVRGKGGVDGSYGALASVPGLGCARPDVIRLRGEGGAFRASTFGKTLLAFAD